MKNFREYKIGGNEEYLNKLLSNLGWRKEWQDILLKEVLYFLISIGETPSIQYISRGIRIASYSISFEVNNIIVNWWENHWTNNGNIAKYFDYKFGTENQASILIDDKTKKKSKEVKFSLEDYILWKDKNKFGL